MDLSHPPALTAHKTKMPEEHKYKSPIFGWRHALNIVNMNQTIHAITHYRTAVNRLLIIES
jgi:hypothetical protein